MLLLQSEDLETESIFYFYFIAGILPSQLLLLKTAHDLCTSCVFQSDILDFCADVLNFLENFEWYQYQANLPPNDWRQWRWEDNSPYYQANVFVSMLLPKNVCLELSVSRTPVQSCQMWNKTWGRHALLWQQLEGCQDGYLRHPRFPYSDRSSLCIGNWTECLMTEFCSKHN